MKGSVFETSGRPMGRASEIWRGCIVVAWFVTMLAAALIAAAAYRVAGRF